ncbi:MAG: metalloregulator ArsR/SmtB family transcription factor [Dehalococcoidia bacterium]|nr:metalloregulator ArsR/SmtB family transcription factor [Dehalococcoidia bacterium]
MATEVKAINDPSCCGVDEEPLREVATHPDGRLVSAATLFKALSDETRLRIVRTMAQSQSELCECNIVPLFGLSQSTISYHLKVLREAGLVESEKRGLWSYYRVNPRVLMAAVKTLADLA